VAEGVSVSEACRWFGINRQAYYQARQAELQRSAEDALVLELVRGIRQRHPRMGVRKLYHELQEPLAALGITRGRDRLFTLLRQHHLLVPIKRNQRRTTRSGLWHHPNLLPELTLERVHQLWVGDITYLLTEQGFLYLALLTDAFSRFIVGYDLSTSLAHEGCLRALNQAIAQAHSDHLSALIHHTDHGVQYSSWPYLDRLQTVGIRPSMGAVGNCYDNALAERMNGILKIEYGLDDLFVDSSTALQAVEEAIWLYNFERPHTSLNMAKPAQIHLQS
jgi:transposase InsO family protein